MPAIRCKLVTKKIYIYSLIIKGKSLHLQRVHAAGIRICQKHGLKQWKVCPERQRLPKTEIDKDRD